MRFRRLQRHNRPSNYQAAQAQRMRARLRVEALEDRTCPSNIPVVSLQYSKVNATPAITDSYVYDLFHDAMFRAPNPTEFKALTTALNSGAIDGGQAFGIVVDSAKFHVMVGDFLQVSQVYLGHPATLADMTLWEAQFQTNLRHGDDVATAQANVVDGIGHSDEFVARNGDVYSLSKFDFVNFLFQSALHRDATPDEQTKWQKRVGNTDLSRDALMVSFLDDPTIAPQLGLVHSQDLVDIAYLGLWNTDADSRFDGFVSQVQSGQLADSAAVGNRFLIDSTYIGLGAGRNFIIGVSENLLGSDLPLPQYRAARDALVTQTLTDSELYGLVFTLPSFKKLHPEFRQGGDPLVQEQSTVNLTFETLLGRDPNSDEQAQWVAYLQTGHTPADLETQIIQLPEFTQNTFSQNIQHYVIIYQENWSLDSLYGLFPGVNGLAQAVDPNGNLLVPQSNTGHGILGESLQPIIKPIGNDGKPDPRFPDPSVSNDIYAQPYDPTDFGVTDGDKTGDIVHRFWHEQSQIDGGLMDQFARWSDNPGLVLSYFDATNLPEGNLAQEFTLDDDLFHSAFGGSFLNHQFLVAAQAPVFPDAATITPSSLPTLDANGNLARNAQGKIIHDGKITPINSTFDKNYAVNTIYSKNLVPSFKEPTDADLLPSQNDSDPTKPNYIKTIGDELNDAGRSWKWYSGGWDLALSNPAAATAALFQWHHQPFAYYDNFAPNSPGGKAHLQDEQNYFADIASGNLPYVSFIKPLGPNNEHPGYADLVTGQQHVADLVNALRNSPYWGSTAIVITYDENGGRWDHVAPPELDIWGTGTRVPGIVISPFSKHGFVDHSQYETVSIIKTIEQVNGLAPLSARDSNTAVSGMWHSYSFAPTDLIHFNHPTHASFGPYQHVLILSVDGLRQADVADPALQASLSNLNALEQNGVTFTNASTSRPSDSFPGALSYLTGAHPGTTGVFYDDSYDRALAAPGTRTPGSEIVYDESVDKNLTLLSGGGNFDVTSIEPRSLPLDLSQPNTPSVYPHSFLKVNTIFDVANQAGLYTAFSDKHPSYDLANGPSGHGINDFYSPEIAASVAWDPALNKLVDASDNVDNLPLVPVTSDTGLTEHYDDLKVQAILNEIDGWSSQHTAMSPVPNLFAMNFQAVSVSEKSKTGGIDVVNGVKVPSAKLLDALSHTDAGIGRIVAELKARGLWDSTLVIVTAKHGQNPRLGQATLVKNHQIKKYLESQGIDVAQDTEDDVSIQWLADQSQTSEAVADLQALKASRPDLGIDQILSGDALKNYHLGDPSQNTRTPDIVVTLLPGFVYTGNIHSIVKRAEHGGFVEDDTHVALIVGSGGLANALKGTTWTGSVETMQVAVTALEALGLNPAKLQGATLEGTTALPGLDLPIGISQTVGQSDKPQMLLVATFTVSDGGALAKDFGAVVNFQDDTAPDIQTKIVRNGNTFYVYATHTFRETGVFNAYVAIFNVNTHVVLTAGFNLTVQGSGASVKQAADRAKADGVRRGDILDSALLNALIQDSSRTRTAEHDSFFAALAEDHGLLNGEVVFAKHGEPGDRAGLDGIERNG
jgi:acid phosphatase